MIIILHLKIHCDTLWYHQLIILSHHPIKKPTINWESAKHFYIRLLSNGSILVLILVGLSIPMMGFLVIGNIINPNGGLWAIKHNVPAYQTIFLPE